MTSLKLIVASFSVLAAMSSQALACAGGAPNAKCGAGSTASKPPRAVVQDPKQEAVEIAGVVAKKKVRDLIERLEAACDCKVKLSSFETSEDQVNKKYDIKLKMKKKQAQAGESQDATLRVFLKKSPTDIEVQDGSDVAVDVRVD